MATEVDTEALFIIEEDWVVMVIMGLGQNHTAFILQEMVTMANQEEAVIVVVGEDIIQIMVKEVVMCRETRIEKNVVDIHVLIHTNQGLNIEKGPGKVRQEPDPGLLCKFDTCKVILRSLQRFIYADGKFP